MFANKEQILIGTTNYIEEEIAKKAIGANKFFTYFSMPIINKKINKYIDDFSQNEMTKDMFDENQNANIDTIYNMAKDAVRKSGPFTLYGIIFNETDIDKLHTYITNVTGG